MRVVPCSGEESLDRRPYDLAHGIPREGFDSPELWDLVLGQVQPAVLFEISCRHFGVGGEFDGCRHSLTKAIVGNAHHGGAYNPFHFEQDPFDLGRIDVGTAPKDQRASPIANEEVPILVELADVSRVEHSMSKSLCRSSRRVQIAEHRLVDPPQGPSSRACTVISPVRPTGKLVPVSSRI